MSVHGLNAHIARRIRSNARDDIVRMGESLVSQIVLHLTAGLVADKLIQQFERDPLVLAKGGLLSLVGTCDDIKVFPDDRFKIRDHESNDASRTKHTKTFQQQGSSLRSCEMFEHMGGIAGIDLFGSEGKAMTHIPRSHLRAEWMHIQIGPGRMPGCATADIDESRLHRSPFLCQSKAFTHIAAGHARSGSRRLAFTRPALARLVLPAALIFWIAASAITLVWRDQFPWYSTVQVGLGTGAIGLLILVVSLIGQIQSVIGTRLRRVGPWLLVLGIVAVVWQVTTAKLGFFPRLYFPPPQAIVDAYTDDGSLLLESLAYSLRLLALGYGIGAMLGFLSGLAMGWSPTVHYWLHPVLRVIGPVPATAWLPIVFVVFPTSFTASIFLIALATWFPVAILTWSGVRGVGRNYYDVARTLGATDRFLIWKVAVPAALPSIFVGLFMGLGASFVHCSSPRCWASRRAWAGTSNGCKAGRSTLSSMQPC